MGTLPTDSKDRKDTPLARGVLDYFPAALAAVARLSKAGNDKHNPGEPMHHARGKSTDHADCIIRHLVDRGTIDPEDGILHDVKVAWRALALLQETLEARGEATLPRGARIQDTPVGGFGTETGRMVPVIHSIGPEGGECPNVIDSRIAGQDDASTRVKQKYYRDLEVGGVYGSEGYCAILLTRFAECGMVWGVPFGLDHEVCFYADDLKPAKYDHLVWDDEERAKWL